MADPKTVDRLVPGDHVCWTFDDHERHLKALVRFVRTGVSQNHQVLYFTDTFLPRAFLVALEAYGVEVAGPQHSGQLQVAIANESHLTSGGAFEAERALEAWSTAIENAREQGYAGLRVAIDMGWIIGPEPGTDQLARLARYEAQANRVFSEGYAIALCCYDRRLFTAAELERLGAAHPGTARAGAGATEEWEPLLRVRRTGAGLTLAGEADETNRDALAAVLEHLVEDAAAGDGPVTLDVAGLVSADLSAVRLLAGAVRSAPARIRLAGVHPPLTDLLAAFDPDERSLDGLSPDRLGSDGTAASGGAPPSRPVVRPVVGRAERAERAERRAG
ncbi:ABC-type transporter Mla MlaB component [Streptosporangium becharense]|uniref:ABC-type transporter Mla MlaB component n=1 Tax=Streptosporangium becharense TaxID=1816182 RepID=A0A7W9IEQ1_9ACTN|nr:MEDS domain-containing protein [Streptosporangium becharense]MBB2909665.1 ABC-type transporter Mla MlaB component [Streptosporangium becharense]MBB5819379.1 ABC-type transporter Mla MlaB component [Streptosporangium becharense]